METITPSPYLTAVTTTADPPDPPAGVDARTDALLRLGQAALDLGGAAKGGVSLYLHGLPRAAFDALPGSTRTYGGYTSKTVELGANIDLLLFTNDPEPEPAPDWFAIAQRITGARP